MKTETFDIKAAVTKKSTTTTIKTPGIFFSSNTQLHLTTNPNASGSRPQSQYQQNFTKNSDLSRYFTIFSSGNMESTTTHINLIDDEDEKDPLALDTSSGERSSTEDSLSSAPSTSKHSHSLRRHVPRIIVKPILPDKKQSPGATTGSSGANVSLPSSSTSSLTASMQANCPSSGRTSSSRRIQQQQQAKAAALAAAASAAAAANATTATTAITQASTMREVLASIPGFSIKPRRRSSKKISTAAQIEQTKDGKIDLETPDSILASTNLRALLNKQTFSLLPPLYQYNLIQLLPSVDRETIEKEQKCPANVIPTEAVRLGPSSLNNEFFARACLEWRERLGEGEFTPENQMKLKAEAEREKNKLDPWKLKHFEPIWGEKYFNRASCSRTTTATLIATASADVCVNDKVKKEVDDNKMETSSTTATCTIVVTQTTSISTTTATERSSEPRKTGATTTASTSSAATASASSFIKNEALTSNSPTCSLNSSTTNSSHSSCSLDELAGKRHVITSSSPRQHKDFFKEEDDDDDVVCIETTMNPTSISSSSNIVILKQENYDQKTESKPENYKKEIEDDVRILQDLPTSSANAIKLNEEIQRRGTKRPSNSPIDNKDLVDESNNLKLTSAASILMKNETNLDENVPTEVNSSMNSSSDDVIYLDGPTTSKKSKIEKVENINNDSNTNSSNSVCETNPTNYVHDVENVEEDVTVAPNPNMSLYLDEQNKMTTTKKIMTMTLTMNKQKLEYVVNSSNSNSNSNSNSATNSCSSTPPPLPTAEAPDLSATITTVNSTCDSNLPYTMIGSDETAINIRDQKQQDQSIYTHATSEIEHEHQPQKQQQHQRETLLLTNSMQLDNCNDQLLNNSYNNTNIDEDEDDIIEQKFNDAENYVLESGEVRNDDSKLAKTNFHCVTTPTTTAATTNVVATSSPITTTIIGNESVVSSADFLYTNSLDQGKLI